MIKPLSPRKKAQKIITEIDGGWYMERIDKVLPPLKIPKPIKKSQQKQDEKKLYEANRYWNDWKF